MSTILDKIVATKKREVTFKKASFQIKDLTLFPLFSRECFSLKKSIQKSSNGIIAEHKRRSPSKQVINFSHSVEKVIKTYEEAGVSGISILTDNSYFGGSLEDLLMARAMTNIPLLRKDFIIDTYQIYEAKAYGADAILLIAAILTEREIKEFSELAKSLGLDVLIEVHSVEEIKKSLLPTIDIIGVNNRNLKDFTVDLEHSIICSKHIPEGYVKISESGLKNPEDIQYLKKNGFEGFLIGESFMKEDDIKQATDNFISAL